LISVKVILMPACAVQGPYLPGYTATPDEPQISYGLQRLDHAVGNVHKLVEALEHIMGFTGWWMFCVGITDWTAC
jgi:hypothetical protein